jgi:hypothetical protein
MSGDILSFTPQANAVPTMCVIPVAPKFSESFRSFYIYVDNLIYSRDKTGTISLIYHITESLDGYLFCTRINFTIMDFLKIW